MNSLTVVDEYVGLQTDSTSSCSKTAYASGAISATGVAGATISVDAGAALAADFRPGISRKK
jgi:hypothetical protein